MGRGAKSPELEKRSLHGPRFLSCNPNFRGES